METLMLICTAIVGCTLLIAGIIGLAMNNGKLETFKYDAESWKHMNPDWNKDNDFPLGVGC